MAPRALAPWALVAWAFVACEPLGSPAPGFHDGGAPIDANPGRLDGAPDASSPVVDASRDADRSLPDARGDAAPSPDAQAHGPIQNCADACLRLATCGRLDPFGDEATCLERCGRLSSPGSTDPWFDCLAAEAECGLVHLCRPPEAPPLSCPAVCAAVEQCGVELPPDVCAATCAQRPGVDRCADWLRPRCAPRAFWACVDQTVDTPCAARCAVTEACGLEGVDCLEACVAAGLGPDPLAGLRHADRTRCAAEAGDCDAARRCLDPEPEMIDRATFCAAWDDCAASIGLSCDEGWARGHDQPGYPTCVVRTLREGCPAEPYRLFERCLGWVDPATPDCGTICDLRAMCGQLPAGERALDCARTCNGRLASGRTADIERARRDLACAHSGDCVGLEACLHEADPATPCGRHCDRLARCGAAGPDCAEACESLFFRGRRAAERACVLDAGDDCAAVSGCVPGPPVGCDAMCGRLTACGFDEPDCALDCDDAHFTDPNTALARMACVAVAPMCSGAVGARGCMRSPAWTGGACLGWCRAALGCVDDGALEGCVEACGRGLTGVEAVTFERARGCLELADPLGPCAPLEACVQAAPPTDCAAWCAALDGCALAPDACEALCAADALTGWRAAATAPCFAAAADCDALGLCLHTADVFFTPAERDGLCARNRACGFEAQISCAAYFSILPDDIGFLRCMLDGLVPCPAEPEGLLLECLNRLQSGPDALPPCRGLCRARQRCGQPVESVRDCASACVEAVTRDPQGEAATALGCGTVWSCAAFDACVAEAP